MTANSGATKRKMYPEMDYFMNESVSDITFVVNNRKIPAVKSVLSFKSEVFRAQFSGNFVDNLKKEIVVEDTTCEAFVDMLRFLHKEELALSDMSSVELAKEVYQLADKYQLFRLMAELDKHFERFINSDNLMDIASFASNRSLKDLIKVIKQFMANNIDKWIDRDIEVLFELNAMTDNSLIHVIVKKFKETKTLFNNLYNLSGKQYSVSQLGQNNTIPHLWNDGESLTKAVPFTFDKVDNHESNKGNSDYLPQPQTQPQLQVQPLPTAFGLCTTPSVVPSFGLRFN